ncbi:MAG: glycosyl hydrolase family 28-related protein [Candidatus Omnitrophota bacterium]|nr:glycosyl hydrolase family 28-related protein [Candidatus Omnitrophota bacterium]
MRPKIIPIMLLAAFIPCNICWSANYSDNYDLRSKETYNKKNHFLQSDLLEQRQRSRENMIRNRNAVEGNIADRVSWLLSKKLERNDTVGLELKRKKGMIEPKRASVANIKPTTFDTTSQPAVVDQNVDTNPEAVLIPVSQTYLTVNVKDYGAVGDGVADDAPAIQKAVDEAPAGSMIVFEAGKTYKINQAIEVDKALVIDGNGATLLLNTSAWPDNKHIVFSSPLIGATREWTEEVKKGQRTFLVSVSTDEIKAQDKVFLQLGRDIYDGNEEEHYAKVVTVVENTGSSITLDVDIPYDIFQGTNSHKITKVKSFVDGAAIRNINLDFTAIATPDASIWIDRASNVTVENITGRFSILLQVVDSTNVILRNVDGEAMAIHGAAGRVLSSWQSDNTKAENIRVRTQSDAPVVFFESWDRNATISDMDIEWNLDRRAVSNVFHFAGASYGIELENITIHNANAINVVGSGAQPSQYHIGTVNVSGPVISADLSDIDHFVNGQYDYANYSVFRQDYVVAPGQNDFGVPLVSGITRSIKAKISNYDGIRQIYLINHFGQGMELVGFLSSLTPEKRNDWNELPFNMYGLNYPANYHFDGQGPTWLDKELHFYTDQDVPENTVLSLEIEYFSE